jgi:gamma-glutamyltranspeptidase/glutathione hydrolase
MPNFSYDLPYPSQRMPVLARNVVATSQPLAAQAGLRMLLAGGNAVDAALAAAIALTVVEPTSNGIGSDAFAIVWDGTGLHGLNASGRSPAAWTPDVFATFGAMPLRGWPSVTVPGAVSAWVELSNRFGSLPFAKLFEPAIEYARGGFPVSPIPARAWERSVQVLKDFPTFLQTFAPDGHAPRAGQTFRSEDHARTLEHIAASKGESFYRGDLAERIARCARDEGGLLTAEDLASHSADWVETISTDYGKSRLHEIPPNGQGLAALLALGILRDSSRRAGTSQTDSADFFHMQIEAMKLALADAHRYVSDPAFMDARLADLLDDAYARDRAKLINPGRATTAAHGVPRRGDTVYLTTADARGMMVSFIQSNYYGFGSGVVVPGTGIALQNRGAGFTLEANHPNRVGPRKRPFHTIIPAFVTRDGRPQMSFGVMGGPMQAQGHVQMMVRVFDRGQNPQAASDAPRWQVTHGLEVLVERGFAPEVLDALKSRGHDLKFADPEQFGGAQLIYKLDDGYLAASDHRKDGQAVGF